MTRGVVVVFTRKNCPHCVYVTDLLRSRVEQVNREFDCAVSEEGSLSGSPDSHPEPPASAQACAPVGTAESEARADESTPAGSANPPMGVRPSLSLRTYDCSDGARAAQCITYVGGTTTVPHVFFNRNYIGDANTVISMEQDNVDHMMSLLREAAAEDCQDFPPTPDASMIKVTESEAFSSQPTEAQLKGLYSFGFRSLINVQDPEDQAFFHKEGEIMKSAGVDYFHIPFGVNSSQSGRIQAARQTLRCIATCRKPVLIHCDTGRRSCALTLLYAAKVMKTSVSQVKIWGKDLGHNFHAKSGIPYAWVSSFLEKFSFQESTKAIKASSPDASVTVGENPTQVAAQRRPPNKPKHSAPPLPPPESRTSSGAKHTRRQKAANAAMNDLQALWQQTYPIHAAACASSETRLVEVLRTPKLNLEQVDKEGWTALHYAAWNGKSDSVRLLLKAGACAATRTQDSRKTTALHYAAGMGHPECVSILLGAGADAQARDAEGWTPKRVAEEMSKDSNFKNQSGLISPKTWQAIVEMCS